MHYSDLVIWELNDNLRTNFFMAFDGVEHSAYVIK